MIDPKIISFASVYFPAVAIGIFILIGFYLVLQAFKHRKYLLVYIPALVLILAVSTYVFIQGVSAKVVFDKYSRIAEVRQQIEDKAQDLIRQVEEQFTFTGQEKYLLYKKGTLSSLYAVKVSEAVSSAGWDAERISFSRRPEPVIADLSERNIRIDFVPFVGQSIEPVIHTLGVLQEYFVILRTQIKYQPPRKNSLQPLYTLSVDVKQWEWGRSEGVGNPYVGFYVFTREGDLKKVYEGYFWQIYPNLVRNTAYFVKEEQLSQ